MSGGNLDLFRGVDVRHPPADVPRQPTAGTWQAAFNGHAVRFLEQLPLGGEFTGETLRLYMTGKGVGEPRHPNCWSVNLQRVLRGWKREGRVAFVGTAIAYDPTSRGRLMRRYRKEAP